MTESPFEISEPMTIHQPSIHANLRAWGVGLVVLLMLMLATFEGAQAKQYGDIEQQRIEKTFPQTDSVSAPEGRFKAVSYTHLTLPTNREV